MSKITINKYTNEHGHPILEIFDNGALIEKINLYEIYLQMKIEKLSDVGAKILLPSGEMVAC